MAVNETFGSTNFQVDLVVVGLGRAKAKDQGNSDGPGWKSQRCQRM